MVSRGVRRALRGPFAAARASRAGGGRRAHGFTLLEVMAAVAVLGILTTVLVRVASQGMAAEGDARRRLEASLLADQVLLELETAWKSGQPLEMGRVEDEREGFAVVVDVAPLDPATFGFGAALEPPPEEGRRGGGRREAETGAPSLFSAAGPNQPAILGFVTVVVSWMEGAHEQAVTRTSFALDRQAAAPLLEPLAPEGSGGIGGEGGVPEGISLPQGAQPRGRGGLPRGGLPR